MPPPPSARLRGPQNEAAPEPAGESNHKVNRGLVEGVGADQSRLDEPPAGQGHLPPRLNIDSDVFPVALKEVVERAVNRWYDSRTVPEAKRQEMNGYRENDVKARLAYKARPLDGVWATPPFLHNGSVPDIEALLGPVAD